MEDSRIEEKLDKCVLTSLYWFLGGFRKTLQNKLFITLRHFEWDENT